VGQAREDVVGVVEGSVSGGGGDARGGFGR